MSATRTLAGLLSIAVFCGAADFGFAQTPAKKFRVGVLQPGTVVAGGHLIDAFVKGMNELGSESRREAAALRFAIARNSL